MELAPDASAALPGLIEKAKARENFGNGRYVRSVFEIAFANMAQRAVADELIEPSELGRMTAADLPGPDAGPGVTRRRIGFRSP